MTLAAVIEDDEGITVEVQVVPRASRERIGPPVGDRVKIQLTAPPVDGAANEALISLLAKSLRVPKRQVRIVQGERGRKKTVRIDGVRRAAFESAVAGAAEGA